jgi:hypothetical protein
MTRQKEKNGKRSTIMIKKNALSCSLQHKGKKMDVSAILFSGSFFASRLRYWLCQRFIIMHSATGKKEKRLKSIFLLS